MPDILPPDVAEPLLTEYVQLLTDALEPDEVAQGVARVLLAYTDPDRYFAEYLDEEEDGWLLDAGVSLVQAALTDVVWHELCISDKIDELYEQLQDSFEPPLPPAPAGLRYAADYFRWLDELLRARGPQPGGYQLLEFGDSLSDEVQVIVVRRADTPRLLDLARQFGIRTKPTDLD